MRFALERHRARRFFPVIWFALPVLLTKAARF